MQRRSFFGAVIGCIAAVGAFLWDGRRTAPQPDPNPTDRNFFRLTPADIRDLEIGDLVMVSDPADHPQDRRFYWVTKSAKWQHAPVGDFPGTWGIEARSFETIAKALEARRA